MRVQPSVPQPCSSRPRPGSGVPSLRFLASQPGSVCQPITTHSSGDSLMSPLPPPLAGDIHPPMVPVLLAGLVSQVARQARLAHPQAPGTWCTAGEARCRVPVTPSQVGPHLPPLVPRAPGQSAFHTCCLASSTDICIVRARMNPREFRQLDPVLMTLRGQPQ